MSNSPASLRIALVGIGNVAMGNYLPVLREQKHVVLGLCDRKPERAREMSRTFSCDHLESLEAVSAWAPTSVLVTTQETTRFEVVMKLLELGVKRIFCEKPLVAEQGQARVTEGDFFKAKTLVETARRAGCRLAMNFNYRSFDQTQRAREIVTSRKFGALTQVAGQVHYACWSHCIDLIHFYGGEVEELTAVAGKIDRQGHGPILAPDLAASFRLAQGAVGTLAGTAGMAWQYPLFEMHFTFEGGRIHMRDIDGDLEVLDTGTRVHERHSMVRDGSRWDHYGASFRKAIPAYLDSIRHETEPPVSGIDGLRELQVEAAIQRSIAQKRAVRVQEDFPL